MTEPTDSPCRSREFQLKWEMGARGAAAIATRLPNFDAQIELGREGLWFNGKSILDFMLATRIEGAPLITVRTSGPDAEKTLEEFTRLFDSDAQPPCDCGKPRLINWVFSILSG